jgi:hypothetical protein
LNCFFFVHQGTTIADRPAKRFGAEVIGALLGILERLIRTSLR